MNNDHFFRYIGSILDSYYQIKIDKITENKMSTYETNIIKALSEQNDYLREKLKAQTKFSNSLIKIIAKMDVLLEKKQQKIESLDTNFRDLLDQMNINLNFTDEGEQESEQQNEKSDERTAEPEANGTADEEDSSQKAKGNLFNLIENSKG